MPLTHVYHLIPTRIWRSSSLPVSYHHQAYKIVKYLPKETIRIYHNVEVRCRVYGFLLYFCQFARRRAAQLVNYMPRILMRTSVGKSVVISCVQRWGTMIHACNHITTCFGAGAHTQYVLLPLISTFYSFTFVCFFFIFCCFILRTHLVQRSLLAKWEI